MKHTPNFSSSVFLETLEQIEYCYLLFMNNLTLRFTKATSKQT